MIQYPLIFSANANSEDGTSLPWNISAGNYSGNCSIPLEFGGAGGAFSPEDLFLLALINCFIATFKVYTSASRLKFENIHINANLILNKTTTAQAIASDCEFSIKVTGAENSHRIHTILQKVANSGILLNSVKTNFKFRYEINGEIIQ